MKPAELDAELMLLPIPFSPKHQAVAMSHHIKQNWSDHPQILRNLLPALIRWKTETLEAVAKIDESISFVQRTIPELEADEVREKALRDSAPERSKAAMEALYKIK
jgi:hypothetical protein